MKKPLKKPPVLRTEEKARDFWGASGRDSTEYLDWGNSSIARFPEVRLSTKTISLRLPAGLLERIKLEANKRDVPYQALIKIMLADALAHLQRNAVAHDVRQLKGIIGKPGEPAVVKALERLRTGRDAIASRYIGSDKRPGDVARHSKQLLRDRHRAK